MSSSLQNANREQFADVNELLRNLSELVKVRDSRLAYLASAGLERLVALRAAAASTGFVRWNLVNAAPLATGSELADLYRGLMDSLGQLTDALRTNQSWQSIDPRIAEAGLRVQEAWQAMKGRDAA